MDFGLGLVLTFTDRASAGLAGVTTSLQGLESSVTQSASHIEMLGNSLSSLESLGEGLTKAITLPVVSFMGLITKFGIGRASFVENMHLAFTSLIGDAQEASDYMQELMGFAKTTPYTYESITNAAQALIAYGFEQNKILSKTQDGYDGIVKVLGDWAGAVGKGEAGFATVSEILGKINSEGKVTAIRINQLQRQGIMASKIIGNMYGLAESDARAFIKTMSGTQFIDDLLKGLKEGTNGVNGMTGAVDGLMGQMKKTWTGALDTFRSSLKTAGLNLMGAYQDEFGVTRYKFLQNMTASLNNLSDAIKKTSNVLQPMADLFSSVINKGSLFIKAVATVWDSMSSVSKDGTKSMSSLQKTISKIVSGLTLLGPILLVVSKVGGGLVKAFITMKATLKSLFPFLTSFGLALTLLAVAWKNDFAGMRTSLSHFTSGVISSFTTAKNALSGDVAQMTSALKPFKDKDDFFSGLTIALARVMTLFKALGEGWNDFTLNEDTYLKAKELGILPLIEALFDLKYRFDHFKKGWKEGWKEIGDTVKSIIGKIAEKVDGTIFEKLFDKITGFFQKLTDNDPKAWESAGKVCSKIAAGLIVLWGAVKLFRGIVNIGGFISSLFGLGKKSKGNDSSSNNSSSSSSSGGLLTHPLQVVKMMSSIAIIVGGMTVLLVALGALMQVPYFKKFLKQGTKEIQLLFENIIPIAGSIAILGLLIKAFDAMKIKPTTALKGLADFAIILGGMSVIIAAVGLLYEIPYFKEFVSKGADSVGLLFDVLASMFSLKAIASIALIALFGNIPVSTTAKGIANLAIVLGGLDVLVIALGALNSIPHFSDFLDNGASVINTLFSILENMFNLRVLGSIALIALFGAVPVTTVALGIANLAIVLAGLDVLVIALGALNAIPHFGDFLSSGAEVVRTLFSVLESMFNLKVIGSIALISLFGVVPITTVLTGIANLALVLGGLTAIISAFGALSKIPHFDEFIKSGGDTLALVFEQLGKVVGAVIGGFAEGLTIGLPEIGQNLSDFATNGKEFFDMIGNTSFDGISSLASALGDLFIELTGEKILSFITGGVDLPALGEQLSGFAEKGKTFFVTVANLDESAFTNAKKMFDSLHSLNKYEFKTGGLSQLFTGTLDLSNIGKQLSQFATNSRGFFTTASSMDENNFSAAVKMFGSISSLDRYEFKKGGLSQLFTGTLDLGNIGSQLSQFALKGKKFFEIAGDVPSKSIESAMKIFETLSGLDDFKTGGVAQWFSGSYDFADIGSQLSSFATNAKTFFDIAGSYEDTDIKRGEAMLSIIEYIGSIQSIIDESGNSWGSLSDIGADLSDFATKGKSFFSFAKNSFDDDTEKRSKNLINFIKNLTGFPENTETLKDIGKNLSEFAKKSKDFFDLVKSLDDATIARGTSMMTLIKGLATTLSTIGSQSFDMGSITSQLTSFATALTTFASQIEGMPDVTKLNTFTASISNFGTTVNTASIQANNGLKSMIANITSLRNTTNKDFSTVSNTVVAKSSAMKTAMTSASSTMQKSWSSSMTSSAKDVNSKMASIKTNIVNGWTQAKNSTSKQLEEVRTLASSKWGSVKNTFSDAGSYFKGKFTEAYNGIKNSFNGIDSFFGDMWNRIKSRFTDIGVRFSDALSDTFKRTMNGVFGQLENAINSIVRTVNSMLQPLTDITGVGYYYVNEIGLPRFAEGGVVKRATTAIVGEAGAEAIVPLKRNTEWIDGLANQLEDKLTSGVNRLKPVNFASGTTTPNYSNGTNYMTTNNNSGDTYEGNTDNSVVFNAGAIQINCQNASDEEALRMAKKIIAIIKRQDQIDKMTHYVSL